MDSGLSLDISCRTVKSSCDNMANGIGLTIPIMNVTVSTAPSRGTKTAVSGDVTGTNLQKQWDSHKHYLSIILQPLLLDTASVVAPTRPQPTNTVQGHIIRCL